MKRCGACGSLLVLHKVFARPDSWVCVRAGCPAWRWDGELTDEPKAGSEPVEKTEMDFDDRLARVRPPTAQELEDEAAPQRVIADLHAEVERLTATLEQKEIRFSTVAKLRAELAAAKEEIERLKATMFDGGIAYSEREHADGLTIAAERAARDRAEARVKELEDVIVKADTEIGYQEYPVELANTASAILAARKAGGGE